MELSKENNLTIILKIFVNYSKILTILLSFEMVFDVKIENVFSFVQIGAEALTQVNPSLDCLLLGFIIPNFKC